MSGMHQWCTQQVGQTTGHVTGIGIMAMQNVRVNTCALVVVVKIVYETVQMIPELLFGKVAGTGLDTHNGGVVAQAFCTLGIDVVNTRCNDSPGHQVYLCNTRLLSQCFRQLHNVQHLPTGISISSQFQPVRSNEPVHTDKTDVKWFF